MLIYADVVIIGAGASGLICASEAGRRGRSVTVLDHASRIGNKIRISGGGRCNFTNRNVSSEDYVSSGNTEFCRSALVRYTPQHFISMLDNHGVVYFEKDDGQLFCSGRSGEVIQLLSHECRGHGVRVVLNCEIMEIRKEDKIFHIKTNLNEIIASSLVIATGGLSYRKLGATDFGYRTARQFGLKVTQLRPALVPLLFSKTDARYFTSLSGISVKAEVGCRGSRYRGMLLFTHRGLSGPAILNLSLQWEPGETIIINLFPDYDIYGHFMNERGRRVEMKNLLSGLIPGRLAHAWCERYIQSRPLNQYTDRELSNIADMLQGWTIQPMGTEGFDKAEVTRGGVDTNELSSKTMEAKKVPGLYFIGEVIDVTGQLGGYNLHWAWASGHAAGQYV